MNYGSVCSGIEAATAAWHPFGWKPAFFSEIDKFPRAVLKHHYPSVPLHGDFTTINAGDYEPIDLLVGGTPCQSFSVAGLRKGLADERGNLTLEFIRLAQKLRPRWIVWENVPGVLSQDGGRAFGAFLGGLAECGYGFAYRILDAQFFGVPQRRRRVFVVGYFGDWRRAAAVLFERHSLQGHPAPRREKGEGVTSFTPGSIGGYQEGVGTLRANGGDIGGGSEILIAGTMKSCKGSGGWSNSADHAAAGYMIPVAIPIHDKATRYKGGGDTRNNDGSANGFGVGKDGDPYPTLGAHDIHAVAFDLAQITSKTNRSKAEPGLPASTLNASGQMHVASTMAVRRLTPRECERLQGFHDIKNCAIIKICGEEKTEIASFAEQYLAVPNKGQSEPVDAHVLIDLERQHLRLLSHGKLLLSANAAATKNWCHHPIHLEDFVRLVALMPQILVPLTKGGKVELPPNIKHFSQGLNGSAFVSVSGREIKECANDATIFMEKVSQCTKFITSEVGQNSRDLDSAWKTWCCCVVSAINSFIQEQIYNKSSYAIKIETLVGYTKINNKTADGPRYKALGNSMAVPVMRWIGERIQMIESITNERTHHD